MTKHWVGVVSREHVMIGVEGGFGQVNHGKEAPLRRMTKGDHMLYYSPRECIADGEVIQAFTAIGTIIDDSPYQVQQTDRFHPYRRNVAYCRAVDAAIRPMLEELSFTKGNKHWGMILRRGLFEITDADYSLIAKAMGAEEI